MKLKFGDDHNKTIGDDCSIGGFPDDGNGRYTQHSGYANWYL